MEALRQARAYPSCNRYPFLVCISFALVIYAGKHSYLPAWNEADSARVDPGDKGSTGGVSLKNAKWKAHHVAHDGAKEARELGAAMASQNIVRCSDMEAVP